MLAVGVRFSEIGTGSFGVTVPENLIHIDINQTVFHKNYPAKIAVQADAKEALGMLSQILKTTAVKRDAKELKDLIKKEKQAYLKEWNVPQNKDKVSPGHFFNALTKHTDDDTFFVVDDGKHTYLAAELLPVNKARHFVSPTDFNCMGFCVPAVIGAKLHNPNSQVIGIVGDGGFLMTGLETLTASTQKLGVIYFIFHDGELGQISQFQKIPLKRKVATVIGDVNFKGIADAVGAAYYPIQNDLDLDKQMKAIFNHANKEQPIIVDVNIDYSKKTYMTKGVVKVNLARFSLKEKMRFLGRAAKRHLMG